MKASKKTKGKYNKKNKTWKKKKEEETTRSERKRETDLDILVGDPVIEIGDVQLRAELDRRGPSGRLRRKSRDPVAGGVEIVLPRCVRCLLDRWRPRITITSKI